MTEPRVSVLIATSNRPAALERCLESVLAQTYDDFEVVVLDYSEEIDSCERIADIDSDVPVDCTHVEEPYGVAGSRNWLMERAAGDIFVFIDDDAAFAEDDAIARTVEGFEDGIGILSFKIIDNPGTADERVAAPLPQSHQAVTDLETSFQVSYFVGAGHAFRREMIRECGDLERDLVFGMEELDISYRAIEHGWRILYRDDIVVHHNPEAPVIDTDSTGHTELHYDVANRLYFAYRHLPARYLLSYLCVWLCRLSVRAVRRRSPREYVTGLGRGVRLIAATAREPLSRESIQYIKQHHGRLWY